MGINCFKLKSKNISPSASCNLNHTNKISVPCQNQFLNTLDLKQNFSKRNKKYELANDKTINLKIFHQNIRGLRNKIGTNIAFNEMYSPSTMFYRTSLKGI